jgi:cytochrome c biogenesis protein CcmG, thiol:disulfide interchange protein DsbE
VTALRVPLLAAVALVLVAPACSGDASATGTVPARNATTAPSLPTVADALPDMDLTGFHTLLDQLKGTPVVVNYWAAWCTPCKAEVPLLVSAHERLGGRIQFLGVDMQDLRSGAQSFMHSNGMTYPSVFDPPDAIGLSYGLFSPPMTQFWDADGNLVATIRGEISREALQSNLAAIAP